MTEKSNLKSDKERRVLAGIFGAMLVMLGPTVIGFPGTWNASYQEHGFFVAGLTAWLTWKHRHRILAAEGSGLTDLMPVLVLLSVAWLFAVIANVRLAQQLLVCLILLGWALVVFGASARRPIASIALTFLLAIPIWSVAVPVLQRATVITSAGATQMAGITADIGYYTITLTTGTFLVEEGCAGLNYLMAGLTLGAFYAHLFVDRWQTQLKVVGLAGAVAIVGNWIRVTSLVFLGEATAMQSPMLEDHLWQGWVIFTVLMVPTYFGARWIERRDASLAQPIDATPAAFDAGRVRYASRAAVAAMVGPILFVLVGFLPFSSGLDQRPDVFELADTWRVETSTGGWTPSYPGIDGRADWAVTVGDARVDLARFYFEDQEQGEELVGYPNELAADSLIILDRMAWPLVPERRLVREVVLLTDDTPRLVWYWYRVGGFDTPFASKAKLLEILAFFRRSPAAELVVMSTACEPEDCAEAATTLRAAVGGPGVFEEAAQGESAVEAQTPN
jgi:EpsI family protein